MWNYPPRQILVPVDFGDASKSALGIAAALGAAHGATITALHAETIEVPPYFTHDQLASVERQRQAARADAERYLARFAHEVAPTARLAFVDGTPVAAILSSAAVADLVVMGTHGRRGPSRWWMGSVAERVVHESPVPVLVTRAVDGSPADSRVFQSIVGVAGPEFDGQVQHYARQLGASFAARVAEKPVESLAELQCDPAATLVVVGVRAQHAGSWFGDAAERLVRSCKLPMLFVPASR